MDRLTLYELNSLVKETIELTFTQQFWVEAELADATERRGHLYLDLVQKDEHSATPIARASARCWASVWASVRPRFERTTRQRLTAGMKVLLRVYPQFHQAYGFSWIVTDIDPTYTLGDMQRQRQEIIDRLKRDGVFDMQRELTLPMFCQRIAVISSATAAGFGDFCNHLQHNDYGFHFAVELFPAIMQGEQVEPTVISALDSINSRIDDFDCVVIIRGGGATVDMSGFNTLLLAENVANFPLPIITGIGHDRDESIIDMISFMQVKTPTAAAAFLIERLLNVSERITAATSSITRCVQEKLEYERIRLTALSTRIPILFSLTKTRQLSIIDSLTQRMTAAVQQDIRQRQHQLQIAAQRLATATQRTMQQEQHRLQMLTQRTAALDPAAILRRGFSMTLCNGRFVTDASQMNNGDIMETRLANGTVLSRVIPADREE
ncbi:MAG: exodeoxyribonuclease VII large subunit [Prevotella sp.]|nr:exodeoxyribonuclease VII large subunit [Prevotella sp.]